ncbi:PIN domain-containing protein [Terriglobus albidus]|uniref:PIN domain-containing protein n=1 Tax=Terriglobus albidus TaxID=1592106 RepID=UPI0021E0AB73|nr:PIN domain-containing protein [Terriglobus albidus]
MRLIVLDTNLVISAGINTGAAPALVMDWVLEGLVQTVTSPWTVAKYREVAQREKFRRYGFPPFWLEFLIAESLHLPDPPAWPLPMPDPKDAPFLSLAHAAGAWLIAGNLKDFPISARRSVTVLSPADYLSQLTEG